MTQKGRMEMTVNRAKVLALMRFSTYLSSAKNKGLAEL
jgi:hypothetical protein